MLSAIIFIVTIVTMSVSDTESQYVECHFVECLNAECHYGDLRLCLVLLSQIWHSVLLTFSCKLTK